MKTLIVKNNFLICQAIKINIGIYPVLKDDVEDAKEYIYADGFKVSIDNLLENFDSLVEVKE